MKNPFEATIKVLEEDLLIYARTPIFENIKVAILALEEYHILVADRDSLRVRLEKWEPLIEAAGKLVEARSYEEKLDAHAALLAALPDKEKP
jgi:hypothetical protein